MVRMSSSRFGWNSVSVWTSHSPSLVMRWRVEVRMVIGRGMLTVMMIRTILRTFMRMRIKMTTTTLQMLRMTPQRMMVMIRMSLRMVKKASALPRN